MRSLICALATALALTVPFAGQATAGDFSKARVLGFSANSKHFVFEEYGFLDGSGTPYLTLYALDVAKDKWLPGTPVRVESEKYDGHVMEKKSSALGGTPETWAKVERETMQMLRQDTAKKAAKTLKGIGPLSESDVVYAHYPRDMSRDGKNARFAVLGYKSYLRNGTQSKVWKLTLQEKSFPAGENCYGQYSESKGYKLSLYNEATGEIRVLNDDKRVPKSRGCVSGYGIEQVHVHTSNFRKGYGMAILIRYTKPGFEGPDGRLLAVTTQVKP